MHLGRSLKPSLSGSMPVQLACAARNQKMLINNLLYFNDVVRWALWRERGRPQQVNDLGAVDEVEPGERHDPVSVERGLE